MHDEVLQPEVPQGLVARVENAFIKHDRVRMVHRRLRERVEVEAGRRPDLTQSPRHLVIRLY